MKKEYIKPQLLAIIVADQPILLEVSRRPDNSVGIDDDHDYGSEIIPE